MYDLYADYIDPYWICLPIALRNAVSQYEPKWTCWGDGVDWIRQPPKMAITDRNYFPFTIMIWSLRSSSPPSDIGMAKDN